MVTAPSLDAAYAACLRLAREHYENFPVASHLLPARMRPHIAAIYAFARTADDFADEPGMPDAERLQRLDDWGARLDQAVSTPGMPAADEPASSIFAALSNTIAVCHLPVSLFHDLLSAFRQDVLRKRYETWDDVLDYCRRSANPVGRLVLRVAGRLTPALAERSDAVCTALQLTNFWQDIGRDWHNGRLYVPQRDLALAGAHEAELNGAHLTAAWQRVMAEMVQRTRALFASGRPSATASTAACAGNCDSRGWAARGSSIGSKPLVRRPHDRPKLSARDAPALVWQAVTWRTTSR